MSSDFIHNKTSGVLITMLIGIIVLSFMFTGYQAFEGGGTTNAIAKVGDYVIKPEEYQQEYNRQIEFFKQMFGGEVSAKQIEGLHIKESTIKNLVQKKLMIKLASEVGTYPSEQAVKEEIKSLPYFKTDGQFDISRYKALLGANRLTPQEFEQDVINQMKMKEVHDLSPQYPVSDAYMADLQKFKEDKLELDLISFSKDSIRQQIEVSKAELDKFMAIPTNKTRIESMFKERKASLDKPEEVTARHILIKTEGKSEADAKTLIEKIAKEVNSSNFSKLAEKYTEDQSGKGKGGSLGSFGKGAMVPEFEKVAFAQKIGTVSAPVKTQFGYHLILVDKRTEAVVAKVADYQEKFAKEMIQKDKVEEIKKLTTDISNNLKKALEANNSKDVSAIVTKYKLSMKKADANPIDGISTGANISADIMKQVFDGDLSKSKVLLSDDGNTIHMIRTYPKKADVAVVSNAQAKSNADSDAFKNVLGKKMFEQLIKKLEKDTTVKLYSNMIQE